MTEASSWQAPQAPVAVDGSRRPPTVAAVDAQGVVTAPQAPPAEEEAVDQEQPEASIVAAEDVTELEGSEEPA